MSDIKCECGSLDIKTIALAEFELDEHGNAAEFIDVIGDAGQYTCTLCGKFSDDQGVSWYHYEAECA